MKNLFTVLLVTSFLVSCSEYDKILKEDNYDKKIEYAGRMFDDKRWAKSINLYEQIYQRMPRTAHGEVAYFRLGKASYEAEDFYMAGYYFNSFAERFPTSINAEEATFLSALCSVKNSPEYSLDQNETDLALNNLQNFIYKYPNSRLIDTCNQIMDNLRFKLEKKSFEGVRIYDKTEKFQAAVIAAETFLKDYPRSRFREEAHQIVIRNSYLLAINSVEEKKKERIDKSNERYLNFVSEFPESSYIKVADTYKSRLEREYNNLQN